MVASQTVIRRGKEDEEMRKSRRSRRTKKKSNINSDKLRQELQGEMMQGGSAIQASQTVNRRGKEDEEEVGGEQEEKENEVVVQSKL